MPDRCPHPDLAGVALEALEPVEHDTVLRHVAGCGACAAELRVLRASRDALALDVPHVTPSPALRARVLAEVRREAALFAAAGAPGADLPPRRAWPRVRGLRLAAGGLVATTAVVLALVVALGPAGGRERVVTASVLLPGDARSAARLVVSDRAARLELTAMPTAGAGRRYEVWLRRPGARPRAVGVLFDVGADGRGTADVPVALRTGDQVMVTAEPAAGSTAPTGAPVLAATV
jgi:hypothetical protein